MDYECTCQVCGKTFTGHTNRASICSKECKRVYNKLKAREHKDDNRDKRNELARKRYHRLKPTRYCLICNKPLKTQRRRHEKCVFDLLIQELKQYEHLDGRNYRLMQNYGFTLQELKDAVDGVTYDEIYGTGTDD